MPIQRALMNGFFLPCNDRNLPIMMDSIVLTRGAFKSDHSGSHFRHGNFRYAALI